MSNQPRMIWLDCLRLVAGVSMLGLHSTADPNGNPWIAYPVEDRIAPLVLRSILYMARTELFIIISVFLLMKSLDRRPRGYSNTMSEQAQRLLLPFFFWTIFFAAFGLIKANSFGYSSEAIAELASPLEWIGYVLLGDVKYHMHFIPTLFGILLFHPIFAVAVKNPITGIVVIVCLIAKLEIDRFLFSTFWGSESLPYLVRATKILTYVGYGLVAASAYGVWKKSEGADYRNWIPVVLWLCGLLFLIKLVAIWKTIEGDAWPYAFVPGYWADFLFPVLIFFLCLAAAHKRWPNWISRLAPYSFGIYLCHPIFLDLAEIALRDSMVSPIGQVVFKISFTFASTSLLVWMISRSRAVAWTIGLGGRAQLTNKNPKQKAFRDADQYPTT